MSVLYVSHGHPALAKGGGELAALEAQARGARADLGPPPPPPGALAALVEERRGHRSPAKTWMGGSFTAREESPRPSPRPEPEPEAAEEPSLPTASLTIGSRRAPRRWRPSSGAS